MAKLTEQAAALFGEAYYGVAATIREDGSPQQTVVWLDYDGENVVFNTAEGREKPRNIRRNPFVSVQVMNPENPYQWVSVAGRAELTHDGADQHIDRLAKKYLGQDSYPWRKPDEQRVIVRVRPEHVIAYGFDGG